MHLRYDEELVEAAVFLHASGQRQGVQPFASPAAKGCTPHPLQIARFHRERDRLYSILDADERNAAFFKLHLEWFREWGLERALLRLVDEFPLFRSSLTLLAFRKARGKNEEGAELFVSAETGRNGVVAFLPERFACDDTLAPFLRHEFMHLNDMLDPAFGYSPQLHLAGQNPAQQRLTRERYRLLWDITIDGRLAGRGQDSHETTKDAKEWKHAPFRTFAAFAPSREARASHGVEGQGSGSAETSHFARCASSMHRATFDRAFNFWSEDRRRAVFDSLWNGPQPRHAELLAMAADPRGVQTAHEPLPGALCPLCGFPTFDWVAGATLPEPLRARVVAEFPAWSPAQGLCGRCRAVYAAAVAAPTAVLT